MSRSTPHEHPHSAAHDPASRLVARRSLLRLGGLGIASAVAAACGRNGRPCDTTPAVALAGLTATDLAGFNGFRERVTVMTDGTFALIESDGMPEHAMMVGIRSWQQQVPLPQPYQGGNAWRVPLTPRLAATPISARHALYRGAIAIAVNGVPIFNALNNRGDDTYLAGELDDFGGHAGRADDYHYHTAPLHLQALAGAGKPIAYVLDGYPLYGLLEPDGSKAGGLDEFNGHIDVTGRYHYHATPGYPYINGGLRGVVTVQDDQIEPQPRSTPIRPSLRPLRGATITGFKTIGTCSYALEYALDGRTYAVNYQCDAAGYTFEFVGPDGGRRSARYGPRRD